MFARKSMPFGAVFMILVIALAFLGVGYSLWSETLTISGDVQTGNVDVEFSELTKDECVDVNGVETCPEPELKELVADCTAVIDGSNLNVEVTGMYPSYHCKVGFKVISLGTVPVHVWLPVPDENNPAWVTTNFENCYPDGEQLHQGQSTTGVCTLDIHFTNEDGVNQNSSATFNWTILATQWNEDPPCEVSYVPTNDPYPGLYGSTVTPVLITKSDCSTTNGLMAEKTQSFALTGWAGWSCVQPGYSKVVGGGFFPQNATFSAQGPAKYGALPVDGYNYPVYPHHTYNGGSNTPGGEEGWVVHAAGPNPPASVYNLCSP